MKRMFSMFLAVAFALSMVGVVFAADNAAKAAAPAAAPAAEKKAAPAAAPATAPAEKKAAKPKSKEVTGTIEAVDAAAGTFTVKGKKGDVNLKAGEKVKLANVKVGDKVTVRYSGDTASSLNVKKSKKSEKKAEAAPAPAAAPAAKPAEKK